MRRGAAAGWLCIAVLAGATAGCLHRRGDWVASKQERPEEGRRRADEHRRADGVTLVLLGNAGGSGRGASTVAQRLASVLEDAHVAEPEPIVLWLGDNVIARRRAQGERACPRAHEAWARRGVDRLAATVREHVARGHASYAIPGEHDWRCGLTEDELQASPDAGRHPWAMPAPNYVVRIAADGSSSIASACDGGVCRLAPRDESEEAQVLVELVMIDASPWMHRDALSEETGQEQLRELSSLLEVLASIPSHASPPRILVSHFPVEAAGWYGQGGGAPDSSWPFLPPALQRSLRQNLFVGVLAAHDLGVYADADLGDALARSDKVWLHAPLFQVVSGGGSVRATGLRRMRHFGSITLLPDLYATGLGFAVARIDEEDVEITLHARHFGRWQATTLKVPLHRPPHPTESSSPAMAPCLRCAEVPASERP